MAWIRINTRTHTKEKPYLINLYLYFFFFFFFQNLVRQKKSIGWAKYMYVSEICAEGIFVTFPWWLKNVKSMSKIALFSNEHHFEIWFPKKKTITFFWSKLYKLPKNYPNFVCDNYIFPKTRETRTNSVPIPQPLKHTSDWSRVYNYSWQELKYFWVGTKIFRKFGQIFRPNVPLDQ